MLAEERASARRQLDKRLNELKNIGSFVRPQRGWIKAIREALGMTTAQLGKRIGVSQPRAVVIEKAEKDGSITLDSLQRAAEALDCQLVYALVPRESLDALVKDRAKRVAENRMESTRHTMSLEAQSVDVADEKEQLQRLIQRIVEKGGSELWDDSL